ncbi:hypothetical protein CC1G_11874 [Coprinopsis cinerea okayama7|uniref:Uncharacterized protein n=1 Tax=Coprinopsis cinerea (strain Okayama-7 / 130 / ATCC MYA-4618 / FGSC 9003) TaxID=240176 RepID=A8NJL4_COPC7|nr:hypothetical protein CC1G_11874 [Coprinopsis cinerea okayama7\|eukprot:XP_001834253.2 hypothetical protein CC1G_11874 [Coprinopsis cinerea okayama7\
MHRPNKRPRLSEPDGFAQTSKPPPPKISAPKFANAFDAPKTTKPVSRGGDVKLAESVFWKGGADGKEKDKGKEDAGAKDRKDKGKEKEVAVRPPPKLQPVRSVKEKGRETLLGYQLPPPLPDVAKPSSSNSKTLKPLGVPQLHVQPRHPPVQQPKVPISARMEAPPLPLPGLNPNTTTAAKESKIIVDPSVLFAVENLVKPDDEGEANVDERRRAAGATDYFQRSKTSLVLWRRQAQQRTGGATSTTTTSIATKKADLRVKVVRIVQAPASSASASTSKDKSMAKGSRSSAAGRSAPQRSFVLPAVAVCEVLQTGAFRTFVFPTALGSGGDPAVMKFREGALVDVWKPFYDTSSPTATTLRLGNRRRNSSSSSSRGGEGLGGLKLRPFPLPSLSPMPGDASDGIKVPYSILYIESICQEKCTLRQGSLLWSRDANSSEHARQPLMRGQGMGGSKTTHTPTKPAGESKEVKVMKRLILYTQPKATSKVK